ncbi:Dev_Cell_Death domain-containing protein [Cephalotus follicularis]|uniref:Dev_Cell_Death domain-containing protein n=1 Tax=Cephalotus follicularis TaxID=3775 RepID=A0A1Q3CDS0_CEPFO|nr:Dev_Cell_Death domain-containing protein [Cephalotus follicularis]
MDEMNEDVLFSLSEHEKNAGIEFSTSKSQLLKENNEEMIMVSGGEEKLEHTSTLVVLGGEKDEEQVMEKVNGEENIEEANDKENVGVTKKARKLRKRGKKKKLAMTGTRKVVAETTDGVETSDKKKRRTRVKGMGMIFMCSSKTKKDCYRYNVLGLPASKRATVLEIYKGMRLFLFDYDLKLLYGIYKAKGPGGYNIEPKAFKSAFPSQVRFTILEDCLPLEERKFKRVIKDNYYGKNKFNCQLTSDQVKNLCKLFQAASKGSKSKKFHRTPRAETRRFIDRERQRRQDREQERPPVVVQDSLYLEGPVGYERERFVSPVAYERERFASPPAPVPLYSPLSQPPPPTRTLPYGYERNLATEVYQREPFLEHRERRPSDYFDLRHQDQIERRDSYFPYRERSFYHNPLYYGSQGRDYHIVSGLPSEYRPAGLPSEYRPAGLPSEYRTVHPSYRY